MNLEIKVELKSFLVKWLEEKFGPQPFCFKTNDLLSKEIRFVFSGHKNNAGNFANTQVEDQDKQIARFVLTRDQFRNYKKYQSTAELRSSIIYHFQTRLYSYVTDSMRVRGVNMYAAIREFLLLNNLDGEDITMEYCKKKVQQQRKLEKKNAAKLGATTPQI